MATNTPNLNLVKPEMSDYADIRVLNRNMDIIDNAINEIMTSGTGSPGSPYLKDVTATNAGLRFTKSNGISVDVPLNYLPLTGGRISGRTYFDVMVSVGQPTSQASNLRLEGAAGNAYMALLNYNNVGTLFIDGYFNNPETATIDVTNRDAEGKVRYRSTLMDGHGNAKFVNDVYANGKLLATKEYVDSKGLGSTTIEDGSVTPAKLDRAYLPLTGGNVTGDLTVNGKTLVYVLDKLVDDTNEKYKITAIKYSDGTLKQTVTSKIQNDSVFTAVTFLVPFTNVDDIILNSGAKLPATDEYKNPFGGSFKSVANLSTTGAIFHFTNQHMYWDFTFTGYWK